METKKLTDQDLALAKYIWSILKKDMAVVWSWGTNSEQPIPNGISFRVQGFILTGVVSIVYNHGTDYFDVSFQKEDSGEVEKVEDVCFSDLVNLIDRKVERTNDYKEQVLREYGF